MTNLCAEKSNPCSPLIPPPMETKAVTIPTIGYGRFVEELREGNVAEAHTDGRELVGKFKKSIRKPAAAPKPTASATGTAAAAAPASSAPAVPLRILVVDDDESARRALRTALRFLGYECTTASDGVEALAVHEAEPVDVILADWRMPRMDGLELCRRTRAADDDERYTYFVFMTSFADREHFIALRPERVPRARATACATPLLRCLVRSARRPARHAGRSYKMRLSPHCRDRK